MPKTFTKNEILDLNLTSIADANHQKDLDDERVLRKREVLVIVLLKVELNLK